MALSHEQVDEIVRRRQAGETQPFIAHTMGISASTVNRHCQQAARDGKLGTKPVLDGFEIKQTSTNGDVTWVKQTHQRGPKFEVPEGMKLTGVSALVNGDDETTKLKWMLAREEKQGVQLTREAVMEAVAEWKGKSEILPTPRGCDPRSIAFYPTADRHLGLLAWGKDSERDWDLEIAQREIIATVGELI